MIDINKGNILSSRAKEWAKDTHDDYVSYSSNTPYINNLSGDMLFMTTDGVGSKLLYAKEFNYYTYIGIDLVAMVANDMLRYGGCGDAITVYYATGELDDRVFKNIMMSVVKGCNQAYLRLIGGETAEMPEVYEDKYDLAATCAGLINEQDIIDPHKMIREGDIIIGLPSNGLHSNGFSLVRSLVDHDMCLKSYPEVGIEHALYHELLRPTRIYADDFLTIKRMLEPGSIHGVAHITGGGIPHKLGSIIPEGYRANIEDVWDWPVIYSFLEKICGLDPKVMYNTFNVGIGMILVVDSKSVAKIMDRFGGRDKSLVIGEIKQIDNQKVKIR